MTDRPRNAPIVPALVAALVAGLLGSALICGKVAMQWRARAVAAESRLAMPAPAPPGDDGAAPRMFGAARYPQPGDPLPAGEMYEITGFEVHDGDTILHATIHLPWNVQTGPWDVRLSRIDAAEVSRARRTVEVTDAELAVGRRARDELAALLRDAEAVYVQVDGSEWAAWGRVQGMVWARPKGSGELIDVASWCRDRGFSRDGP